MSGPDIWDRSSKYIYISNVYQLHVYYPITGASSTFSSISELKSHYPVGKIVNYNGASETFTDKYNCLLEFAMFINSVNIKKYTISHWKSTYFISPASASLSMLIKIKLNIYLPFPVFSHLVTYAMIACI